VDQAVARVQAAKAGFDRWSNDYDRVKRLLADGASTKSEMDATESAYRQAKEQLAEAEAGLALVKAGNRAEDVDSARAQVATATSAVEQLKDSLARMTVTMPFDGFVVRKMTEEGEWLSPGAPVVEVVDIGVVRVQLDVPERYLAGVEKGAKSPVVFEALGDREFAGQVSQVVPRSAEASHTIPVRIDLENVIENGRPVIVGGLLARVSLPVGGEHEALLVPKAAIIRQEGRDVVYRVSATAPAKPAAAKAADGAKAAKSEGAAGAAQAAEVPAAAAVEDFGPKMPAVQYAVAVPVKILQGYGRYVEVESERLKVGEPLVTRGTYMMSTGAEVQVYDKGSSKSKVPSTK
jgi:multidrug efflux pump subunit AcrA (membrane-fusion protein)